MKKFAMALGLAAGLSMTAIATGAQAELSFSWDDMSKSGTHQFYVWCTGKDDYTETAQGANAKEAQSSVAAKAGNTCWPVWQGLVAS